MSTFSSQADAGLSSTLFDIEANVRDGDSRAGLDERGTQEVLEIMRRERVECVIILQMEAATDVLMGVYSFDQARLIRHNQILARNGIDPSGVSLSRLKFGLSDLFRSLGMPMDSKAVTRL